MLRFAGQALKAGPKAVQWLTKGIGPGEMALRVVPDIGFGVMAAAQTPGDFGDKLIAGGTQTLGGVTGGLLGGKLGGSNQILSNMLDMGGSAAGDFAGMAVGDNAQRLKDKMMGGEGLTPWERMGAEQQAQYAQELEQQILRQYGLIPGTREQYADPSTGYGVA
jgi:hypothetical protein